MIPGANRFLVVILLAALFAHGCGSEEPPRSSSPLLALHGEEPAPQARRIEGEVVLDRRGCLRVEVHSPSGEDAQHGRPTMIVPDGYTFDLDPRQEGLNVLDAGGRTAFRVGGPIEATGGYVDVPLRAAAGISGATAERLESQCPGSYLYLNDVRERSG